MKFICNFAFALAFAMMHVSSWTAASAEHVFGSAAIVHGPTSNCSDPADKAVLKEYLDLLICGEFGLEENQIIFNDFEEDEHDLDDELDEDESDDDDDDDDEDRNRELGGMNCSPSYCARNELLCVIAGCPSGRRRHRHLRSSSQKNRRLEANNGLNMVLLHADEVYSMKSVVTLSGSSSCDTSDVWAVVYYA